MVENQFTTVQIIAFIAVVVGMASAIWYVLVWRDRKWYNENYTTAPNGMPRFKHTPPPPPPLDIPKQPAAVESVQATKSWGVGQFVKKESVDFDLIRALYPRELYNELDGGLHVKYRISINYTSTIQK